MPPELIKIEGLEAKYLGQSAAAWLVAFALTVVFALAFYFLKRWAHHVLARMQMAQHPQSPTQNVRKLLMGLLASVQPISILLFSLYLATTVLILPPRLEKFVDRAIILIFVIQLGLWGNRIIVFWLEHLRAPSGQSAAERSALVGILGFCARLLLWALLTLIALNNFGIDITALVAGLGVGGIAVALAVQNILGDLLASLTIALDKPFVMGDAIQVDNISGVIEHIGLKTTRLRSFVGEQVVFSNNDLLKSRIHNFRRLSERTVTLRFGVSFLVSAASLREVPQIVKEIMAKQSLVRLIYIHLIAFGEGDLKFELSYTYTNADYLGHLQTQEAILTQIYEAFETKGIPFAQPRRDVHILPLGAAKNLSLPTTIG